VEDDGFSHMVEILVPEVDNKVMVVDDSKVDPTVEDNTNILKVNPADFDYDVDNDTMKPRNVEEFDNMVEKHPTVDKLKGDDKRESKVANLKKKILDTLKVEEKKKRDLSCESVKSDCSGWSKQ
jgi:hypothetical protein